MRIGNVEILCPFIQAGLAGYSDRAMRIVARRRGCPYAVTEALLDTVMLNGGLGLKRALDMSEEDHPVAGQIIGSEAHQMARAAVILSKAGYDVIDLNFACPVRKIRNRARGGHMLADAVRAIDVMRAVRDALPPSVPMTVKLRRAFDDSPASQEAFDAIIEEAWRCGCAAVCVHPRTVRQEYSGRSDWSFLQALRRRYPGKTIIGSGDVLTAADAVAMLRTTGVDAVAIARGAIGNPWIFNHARRLLAGADMAPPTVHEQREALVEHFRLAMEIHGEQIAARRMRKIGIRYARLHPAGAEVKNAFIAVTSLRTWLAVLDRWYAADGPGRWPAAHEVDETANDFPDADSGPAAPAPTP